MMLTKRIAIIAIIVIVIIIVCGLFDLFTVIGFSLVRPKIPAQVDAVVVLGAKVGTPALTYRTLTGVTDYQTSKAPILLLSGGQGHDEPVAEAAAMADVVTSANLKPVPHLALESASDDTYQNLENTRKLLPQAHTIVLVSDGYHLERAVAIAHHVGFQHVYWDAPKPVYYNKLDLAHYYLREAAALVVYAPRLL